jgi:hypothetical protein
MQVGHSPEKLSGSDDPHSEHVRGNGIFGPLTTGIPRYTEENKPKRFAETLFIR